MVLNSTTKAACRKLESTFGLLFHFYSSLLWFFFGNIAEPRFFLNTTHDPTENARLINQKTQFPYLKNFFLYKVSTDLQFTDLNTQLN